MKTDRIYLLWRLFSQRLLKQPGLVLRWMTGEHDALLSRSRFYTGDFEGALRRATAHLQSRPRDAWIRIFAVCSAIELGDFECAEKHMRNLDCAEIPSELQRQLPCLEYMLTKAGGEGARTAVRQFDAMFRNMGCRPVRLSRMSDRRVFDALSWEETVHSARSHSRIEFPPVTDGPLVSVIMTAFNVEGFIHTSVSSILSQSYRSLEVIVVDDCSTDGTPNILRELAGRDARLQVIFKDTNDGTYVSKNLGMARAQGKYVAFQDGDDWSHPDRIGKSVAVLESMRKVVALTTEHVRMTTEGDLVLTASGRCSYLSHISLVFRRRRVLSRAGFFDSVRAAADAEYRERLKVIFGDEGVVEFPWLLNFTRHRPGSLTAGSRFSLIRGVAGPVRMKYRKSYMRWHASIRRGRSGYMSFPLSERPFKAPEVMLPGAGAAS